ncbi:hypothetical protein A2U01_0115838, partial [Trifolium medium]|nr:hypothetical protein [Trifolium medium]
MRCFESEESDQVETLSKENAQMSVMSVPE